jgi:hypothetical protein
MKTACAESGSLQIFFYKPNGTSAYLSLLKYVTSMATNNAKLPCRPLHNGKVAFT